MARLLRGASESAVAYGLRRQSEAATALWPGCDDFV
jgi:hypothetical protein